MKCSGDQQMSIEVLSGILFDAAHLMSARTDDASVLPDAGSADEAAAPALIVTPPKAGVHAGTGTVVERWTPAFAGVTGGAAAYWPFVTINESLRG
jgi:hypothetical protein